MLKFLPVIILQIFGIAALAQKPLSDSRNSSPYTYFYKLNDADVLLLYQNKEKKIDDRILKDPVDSFLTDKPRTLKPAPGNYLKVYALRNQLEYELVQQRSAWLKLLDNRQGISVVLIDTTGNEIKDAGVYLGKKKMKFDSKAGIYSGPRSKKDTILRADHNGTSNFYLLTREQYQPYRHRYRMSPIQRLKYIGQRAWFRFKQLLPGSVNASAAYREYPGYMVYSKPIYKPNDTVRFKAFILNKRTRKPVTDKTLAVYLKKNLNDRGKLMGFTSAYRKGAFDFAFALHDSLDLRLDANYYVSLEVPGRKKEDDHKRKTYQFKAFRYEDYELKSITFHVRTDKDKHRPGNPVTAYLKATDENGLSVPDGRVQIILTTRRISWKDRETFVPDTLWQHKLPLDATGETGLTLPDSIFPHAAIRFNLECAFLNSSNERRTQSKELEYDPEEREITGVLSNDTLKFAYTENGREQPLTVHISEVNAESDTLRTVRAVLPLVQTADPSVHTYAIKADSLSTDIALNTFDAGLSASGFRTSDSIFVNVNNPLNLRFWYAVYYHNDLLEQGYGTALSYNRRLKKHGTVSFILNYIWGGVSGSQEIKLPDQSHLLQIDVKQPLSVNPGDEAMIEYTVSDPSGKPVAFADLTAYAFTHKFPDPKTPVIPYLGKLYPDRKREQPILIKEFEEGPALRLNWQRWSREMGLDSIAYFRFTHPQAVWQTEEAAPDSITQIAPFVVKDGDIVPVRVLCIDEKPVWFSQAGHLNRYSFRIDTGWHTIRFRTTDRHIKLDSIRVSKGRKLILSVNNDAETNNRAVITKMPPKLTDYEATLLNKYMISIVPNFGDRFATIEQDDRIFLLNPYPSSGYYYGRTNILTGPLSRSYAGFTVKGQAPVFFETEPGYSFEFRPGLLKQTSVKEKYPFSVSLLTDSRMPHYTDYVLTNKETDSLWQNYLDLRSHTTDLFYNPPLPVAGNGKLATGVPEHPSLRKPFVKNVIIYRYDDPDFIRIFPGNRQDFGYLEPGRYRLIYLLKGDTYFLKENVTVKAGGSNYYPGGTEKLYPRDSVSIRIAAIINNRNSISNAWTQHNNDPEDTERMKETFNERYLDASLFKDEVTGTVYDQKDKQPLPGVSIRVKGTKTGVATDVNGNFRIKVPIAGKLEIDFIGYERQTLSIAPGAYLSVYLIESTAILQEVVVVGYGTQKRSALTGAVAHIETIAGKLAGVSVNSANIRIRGSGAVPAGKPLIIVDGQIYEGELATLDPSLIAEMNVLKPDAATAIYGARAADGVILISSKNQTAADRPDDAAGGQQESASFRQNFSDEAFWQTRLTTDEAGKARFKTIFPDDITSWRTFVIGMTGDRQSGFAEGQIKSFKSVSANFAAPAFAVQGDLFTPVGKVMNYTPDSLSLHRSFRYNGALQTDGTIGVKNALTETFRLTAEGKDSLHFEYAVRRPNGYFDGERRSIPLFEKGTDETRGVFAVMEKDTTFTLGFDKPGPVTIHAETSVLPALQQEAERLRTYQYLCNEQLASKLKGLLASKRISEYLGEKFSHDKPIREIIKMLQENRKDNGTWGWWKNTDEELWISLHAVGALLDAEAAGFKTTLDQQKLTAWLVNRFPLYRGISKLDAIDLLKKMNARVNYAEMVREFEKERDKKTQPSLYEDLRLMNARQQAGLPVNTDSLVSIRQQTMLGNSYWGGYTYHFFDNSIQLSLLAYRILRQDGRHAGSLDRVRHYFLEQRKDGHWRNTYESSLILETILPDLLTDGKLPENPSLSFSGTMNDRVNAFPYTVTLPDVRGLKVSKTGTFPVYFTAYQTFRNPEPERVTKDFTVNTWFEKNGQKLQYLTGGETVQLKAEVSARADAEFVMVEIPIPAGCSYDEKEQSWSGNEVHREYFKDKVSIFCRRMSKVPYTFTVKLAPRYSGTYTLNPAKAEMMYFPVFYGREAMKKTEIR